MKTPQGAPPIGHWLHYVSVADCDTTVDKAKRLGGAMLAPPVEIPDIGRFSVIKDNGNVVLAVMGPNKP
jgi:predicted enzyme related to lactoylglutathione lyase